MNSDDRLSGVRSVVSIGECMVELSPRPDGCYALGYAGDTFNAAVYLARAAPEVAVSYLTAVGRDHVSDAMLATIAEQGVGTGTIWRHPTRTVGLYLISVDGSGERSFSYYRSESAARECFTAGFPAELTDRAAQADLAYLSGISLSILRPDARHRLYEVLDRVRSGGGLVVFDSNYRPSGWASAASAVAELSLVVARCDVALPTLADELALHGVGTAEQCAAWYLDRGVSEVVVKLGADGCLLATRAGDRSLVPATAVSSVVDTTAAGDSFNGRYLAERIAGRDPLTAAERAHRTAGHVIRHRGAIAPPEPR